MTWILLRGLTREARHWDPFPAMLAAALHPDASPESRPAVVALDLPGNGTEYRMQSPTSVSAMVASVRARAHATGLPGPYRLLSLSLGGMVATAWAQAHPAEIDRLVLINTSMRPFGWPHQRLRWQVWPRVLQLLRHWHDPGRCERNIHRLTCADDSRLADDLRQWIAIRATATVTRGNALRQLLAAARFSAGKRAPPCPTLILSSAADRLVSPACSLALAQHWNCAYAVHPHAGHDLPHDDPGWVAGMVAAWAPSPDTGGPNSGSGPQHGQHRPRQRDQAITAITAQGPARAPAR